MQDEKDMRNTVSIETLKLFGTNPQVYNQASSYYRKSPTQAAKLALISQECQVQERGVDRPELTVDQTLGLIRLIDKKKTKSAIMGQIGVKSGKIAADKVGQFQVLEKMKAYDRIFID